MRKTLNSPVVILLVLLAACVAAQAQSSLGQAGSSTAQLAVAHPTAITVSPATQAAVSSLSSLPEADLLIYVNPRRILNEAVPKLVPAKDVEEMRKGFDEVKKNVGIDPTKVDYLVIAVRFKKPTDDLNFQPPEFMVVASGDFSAESLMVLARMASRAFMSHSG